MHILLFACPWISFSYRLCMTAAAAGALPVPVPAPVQLETLVPVFLTPVRR